ncbi:MAG: hypothetical protein U0P82_04255 [Vicinamibacterales bacterium]
MRTVVLPAVVALALAVPGLAAAQVYRHETPPPLVTAATADWQVAGEPIFYAGNFYYPAGATVFFDGKTMVRTGVYEGVPLYADVTLEPFSIVFVPVRDGVMQPYERRREGELAGTVGSRVPSFPIERDVEVSARGGVSAVFEPGLTGVTTGIFAPRYARRVRPAPTTAQRRAADEPFTAVGAVMVGPSSAAARPGVLHLGNGALSAPAAQADTGVWIAFEGARWFADGAAVPFNPARFESAGTYRGFPVFRERGTSASRLYVTTVANGPLAPFVRR